MIKTIHKNDADHVFGHYLLKIDDLSISSKFFFASFFNIVHFFLLKPIVHLIYSFNYSFSLYNLIKNRQKSADRILLFSTFHKLITISYDVFYRLMTTKFITFYQLQEDGLPDANEKMNLL